MIRLYFITILFGLFAFSSNAQTSLKIDVENYDSDTLILGYYYADKILVTDTLFSDNQKSFFYEQDSLLPTGMYVIVTRPAGDFYQILINEHDQDMNISIDKNRQSTIEFSGSAENEGFYEYMRYLNNQRLAISNIDKALETADSAMVSIIDQLQKDRKAINDEVTLAQQNIIARDSNSLTSILIKSNLPFEFPEFEGTNEEIEIAKYHYYKERYFDQIDLGNPAILRTPVIDQRISYYMNNLTPRTPDSIITSVDRILSLLEPAEESYQYYLSKFLNEYGNSKYIGMDAVYVHLALNYYGKGKAPWVSEENLREIVSNAKKIEPTLIGKPAPDFTLYQEDGTAVSLQDFKKDFTILMFWKPDCGHCTKAMPHIVKFTEDYKDKSVDLLTVCTKTGEKYSDCWEGVKEKNMETLLNVGDEFHRSRIFSKYHVNSTPAIYILDKNKNIKLKKVPAENLDAVMIELMKVDESEGRMN